MNKLPQEEIDSIQKELARIEKTLLGKTTNTACNKESIFLKDKIVNKKCNKKVARNITITGSASLRNEQAFLINKLYGTLVYPNNKPPNKHRDKKNK